MKRTFLIATLVMTLLLGGSVAIVLLLTTTPERIPAATEPRLDPPLTIAPAPAPAAPSAATAGATSEAPSGPSAAPTASRVNRKAIRRALNAAPLRARLARCMPAADFRAPGTRPASLMLEIETLPGELRIVDARVRDFGGASEATVTCAQTVLRGHVFPAPARRRAAAQPRPTGQRMQMPFLLNPRSGAVASSR